LLDTAFGVAGIKGLRGISAKNGNVIRPLLFAQRTEIEQYALKNDIPYREDSSNVKNT
jgi:tRNA(Ile)-lysidine synthase